MRVKSILLLTLMAMLALPTASAWSKGPKEPKRPKKHVTVDDNGPADYTDIQTALDNAPRATRISVAPGTYGGFVVENRKNLKIERKGKRNEGLAIVTGAVLVSTYKGTLPLTIGVVDSTHIEISGFTVQAGLTDPFTIACFNSTGKIKNNEVYGNVGSSRPGNGIAAFGTSGRGTVTIEGNYIHSYGKIGILVNARYGEYDPDSSYEEADKNDYEPDGIHARIKKNIIVGTDFYPELGDASYDRVQDGIQIVGGGSADIENNDICGNGQSFGSDYSCNGILLVDSYKVRTKHNDIYDNWYGIHIELHRDPIHDYVSKTRLDHDNVEYNVTGIATSARIPSAIDVKHAKIRNNYLYGVLIADTDGILFDHCDIQENWWGLAAYGFKTLNPMAGFRHCSITGNGGLDVEQAWNTLVFEKVKYDTYSNFQESGILIEE